MSLFIGIVVCKKGGSLKNQKWFYGFFLISRNKILDIVDRAEQNVYI